MANIKRALLTSALAIIACVAMPIGSTFAWFTDMASTGENRIEAGRLAVDLLMYKDGKYQSIKDGEGDIFREGTVAQNDVDTLWEPGKTQIVFSWRAQQRQLGAEIQHLAADQERREGQAERSDGVCHP